MAERRVTVASKVGLHARPAAMLAKLAAEQPVPVTIRKDGGAPVAAESVLNLMTLGATHGDEVIIAAEGAAAESALAAVAELIGSDLDG